MAQPEVFVHLLPQLIRQSALTGGVAIVVDVLRATTVMIEALVHGCSAIYPCAEIDEARRLATTLPSDRVLLAGERQGLPIPGFALGNSPPSFDQTSCEGKLLVMTTTNGTRAVLASLDADHVVIAAMTNAASVSEWAARSQRAIHVVCAGTDGAISWEDTLLAGEIVDRLENGPGLPPGNDAALIARALFRDALQATNEQLTTWSEVIARGRGGRRVIEIGLRPDVDAAARRSNHTLVPVVKRNPTRIVAQ